MELTGDDLLTLNRQALIARVLAGTAHDVNNALQIIGGTAEMLGRAPAGADSAHRAADRVQSQSLRAAASIDALVQFARARGQAGARVSLKDVLAAAIALRAYALRRANLMPAFDAAAAPAAVVNGNAARLQQAVLNLIVNAEQALAGRRDGTLRLELLEGSGEARLTIGDNGPGLDPSIAGRLFEPYATTRPAPDSIGLGLAATRLIARHHGGDIDLFSTPEGCTATLRLPCADCQVSGCGES